MATGALNGTASTQNFFASGSGTVPATLLGLTKIRKINTTQTFTANVNDSGSTYVLASIGAVITLPAVASAAGAQWNFVMGAANGTTAWTITPATSVLRGSVNMGATTTAGTFLIMAGNAGATVAFTTTALAGDWLTITCDGANFFVKGQGGAAASFAVA